MKLRAAFLGLLLFTLAQLASAHRLNEYLQATTIDLSPDHVDLTLRMTPGVDVAKSVLNAIDTDHDGEISEREGKTYASRVARDLTLSLDGKLLLLKLTSSSFPAVAQMKKGLADIVLHFQAAAILQGKSQLLEFKNEHMKPIAAYLVNCLAATAAELNVQDQTRSFDQSQFSLRFVLAAAGPTGADKSDLSGDQGWPLVRSYVVHGVHHILTGYDHLLFICALVLGAATLWDLVKVVTAFTIAHSVTLTLAALNLVHLSSAIVEPLISASIVFVAVQNIFWPEQSRGYTRLAIAFFFGLFHGLGFAGGLLDLMHAMPLGSVLLAILGFSLGVELGNQIVLLPLFALVKTFAPANANKLAPKGQPLRQFASAAVSLAGAYYLFLALTPAT